MFKKLTSMLTAITMLAGTVPVLAAEDSGTDFIDMENSLCSADDWFDEEAERQREEEESRRE